MPATAAGVAAFGGETFTALFRVRLPRDAANTTELVVVNQLAPIDVLFSPPEQSLSEINRYSIERKLRVWATPPGKGSRAAEGELTFVDNTVKQSSGTIDVKATFPNEDRALWPGQFVEVELSGVRGIPRQTHAEE